MGLKRVVVTGLGVISGLGKNRAEFWDSLQAGRSGIRPIETVDRSALRFHNGAEVPDYRSIDYFTEKESGLMDRFAQFAVIAAREAVSDARIEWTPELRLRTAIITGSCVGGQLAEDAGYWALYRQNSPRVHPMTIPLTMANAGASHISMEMEVGGPAYTVSTACSSANHAIGQAFWMVRQGTVDMALTGGSEAPFGMGLLKAWEAMRVISPDTCRPFSKGRKGMVLGEGGAILVLETLESAQARGAHIYGEIMGFGMSADAHHITQPSPDGAARAIRGALEDGGVAPEQIGYINAHGTGTPANDPTEVAAIRSILNGHEKNVLVSSTKSMHGHALGAAGAIEAAATLLAIGNGLIPPTANFTEADPLCDVDVVPNVARRADVEYALSNSFAFGGLNAVLLMRRFSNSL